MPLASRLSLALLLFVLLPSRHVVAQYVGGLGGTNLTEVNTSLLVTGNILTWPLDGKSLDALFTRTFFEEAAAKLKEVLGEEVVFYPNLESNFRYVSSGRGGSSGGSHVADLFLAFVDPPEELLPKLHAEAPKVVVEMLRERVQEHLDKRRDQQTRELLERRDRLAMQAAKMAEVVIEFEKALMLADDLVSTEALRQHYLELDKRRREDRLTLLNVAAERQAVEKQIESLRQQAQEVGATSPFLEELKAAAEARHEALVKLRDSAEAHSAKVAELEKKVTQLEKTVHDERTDSNQDNPFSGFSSSSSKQLSEAKRQLNAAHSNRKDALASAEAAAMEGRIEYLRKKEELTQAQFGSQLQSLNGILSQLAIETDTATARSEAIDNELQRVAESIRSASLADLERRASERKIKQLEAKLEQVQNELFKVETLLEQPHTQEFTITPWGG